MDQDSKLITEAYRGMYPRDNRYRAGHKDDGEPPLVDDRPFDQLHVNELSKQINDHIQRTFSNPNNHQLREFILNTFGYFPAGIGIEDFTRNLANKLYAQADYSKANPPYAIQPGTGGMKVKRGSVL